MKSRLFTGLHRRYRPRTDASMCSQYSAIQPRRRCAHYSPGERGKTKPRGGPRSQGRRYGR
jgi:hypothetical protein